MTDVIHKATFCEARQFVEQRLKQVMSGRIKIGEGIGDIDEKEICIMQAANYVLGGDPDSDAPPCTSKAIRNFVVNVNDDESDRRRAQLKKVMADFVNTAPMGWILIKDPRSKRTMQRIFSKTSIQLRNSFNYFPAKFVLGTINSDPDYIAAEKIRADMILAFGDHEKYPMHKVLDFIRELAAVAKFDGDVKREISPTP